MFKRPKPGEDEEDLLRMQEEFLREKRINKDLKPAAQVTNLRPCTRPSEPTKRACPTTKDGARKPSKYAQSKGLKGNVEKKARIETSTGSLMGDILEKNIQKEEETTKITNVDDQVYYPVVIPSVLGNIIEKNTDFKVDEHFQTMPSQGFPEVLKRDPNIIPGQKSIHRLHLEKLKRDKSLNMDVDEPGPSSTSQPKVNTRILSNLPSQSYITTSEDAINIHKENINLLSAMSEQEILEEQQKILANLDPKLVDFIKSRRSKHAVDSKSNSSKTQNMDTSSAENVKNIPETKTSENIPVQQNQPWDSLWDNDVLTNPEVDKWIHFESLEKDKLEWTKGIKENIKDNPDEQFEARFDFKGYLLPYTMEYTEKTKTLYHHGEEPHRPGYSVTELIELTRSSVTQQRVMALNTLAGILEYYNAGTYKDIIELPLTKIFFIVRIALDENKVIILEPALKAMRNLLYNKIDEASLDALIGFEEGTLQPCLENDKTEIEELDSKESELKDYHLAEIDLVSAVLRTDILQRLYYILDAVKPSFNCVQYCLQILIRLARNSVETSSTIVQSEHLMNTVIRNFLPQTTVNFVFDPKNVYKGKPVLAAVKLLRILSLQSEDISSNLVSNYNIMAPISEYISSGVDRTYGLRIQIEATCLLSNLLCYGQGIETAVSLLPVIITTLYKHVETTDVFVTSSAISATHAAVIIQLINRLLICNLDGIDRYKLQIYPLIKVGVQKWLKQLSQSDVYSCAHLRLLCSAIDCSKTVLLIENIPIKFLNDSLKHLSSSQGFKAIVNSLISSSNLLSGLDNKDLFFVKNLTSLGTSVIDSKQKILPTLNVVSPLPFLASLFKLLPLLNDKVIAEGFLQHLKPYFKKLAKRTPSLTENWFTRMETDFVFNSLKLSMQKDVDEAEKDLLYVVANRLCYILRIDKRYELQFLFDKIVFNKDWFTAERLLNLVNLSDADGFSKALVSIEDIKMCYSKVVNLNYNDTGPNVMFLKWKEPILPRDWIYLPILTLYSKSQELETAPKVYGEHARKVSAQEAKEKEFIISCSLEWILFNEMCFPDLLMDIDITDRFCRIMCVFLCDNSLFLDSKIKMLLDKCVRNLFKRKEQLNFDKPLTGLHNFQDFYTQFLEQFQSVSYGDHTFAACVLVPLAQRHNVKWRKLIWSEYAGCLRVLDCLEDLLCYDMNEYLFPEETDESLLKSYFRATSSNLLRPNTIAHRIATHHIECYKKRTESVIV